MADDQHLIAALRQRDTDAFAALFNQYADKLYRVAFNILKNDADAECVVQDSFLKLIEKLDGFEERSSLGTWLYRVATNLSIDRIRKARPTASLADDFSDDAPIMPAVFIDWAHTPEQWLSEDEKHRVLSAAISQLPPKLHTTFILREIEGLSTAETASVLNASTGAVKVQLHRARLQLREYLSTYFSERVNH